MIMSDNIVEESLNIKNLALKESDDTNNSSAQPEMDGSSKEPDEELSGFDIFGPRVVKKTLYGVYESKWFSKNAYREETSNSEMDVDEDEDQDVTILGSFKREELNVTPIKEIEDIVYDAVYVEGEDEIDYSDCLSVLFLSVGNICRAPMAAAILIDLILKRNIQGRWAVDSAALAPLHIKELIDTRASKCLMSYSVFNYHECRLVTQRDFKIFKYYFCMDKLDLMALEKWLPPDFDKNRIKLLGDLHPNGPVELEDPYESSYYDDQIFHILYRKISACISVFLNEYTGFTQENDTDGSNQRYRPVPIIMSDSEEEEELDDKEEFIEIEEACTESEDKVDFEDSHEDLSKSVETPLKDSNSEEDANKFVVPPVSPVFSDDV